MSEALRSPRTRARIRRLGRWLVPSAVRAQGREAVIRSQAILAVVFLGALAGAVSAALDFRLGAPLIGWITLAHVVAGGAIPFVLRRTGSPSLAGNLLVGLLFLMVFTPGVLTLGRGPAVMFLFLVPAFAVLFCGRRAALGWALLAAAGVLVLGALSTTGWTAPVELPATEPRLHRIAFLSLLVATVCLLVYDVMKVAALRDLERANAALHESREQYRQLVGTSPDAVFVTARRPHPLRERARRRAGGRRERAGDGRTPGQRVHRGRGGAARATCAATSSPVAGATACGSPCARARGRPSPSS